MSIGDTTTRLRRVSPRSVNGVNIAGVPASSGPPSGAWGQPKSRSTAPVKRGSRSRRLPWVTRRLRVRRLKANCRAGWSTYPASSSNHRMLAAAARWVEATAGRRAASYAASAAGTSGSVSTARARASASSTASLVPEPIEKWAVCAASPISTVLPCDQCALTTVRNCVQVEPLPRSGRPRRASPKIFAQRAADSASSQRSKPALCQTSSRISTITVEESAA